MASILNLGRYVKYKLLGKAKVARAKYSKDRGKSSDIVSEKRAAKEVRRMTEEKGKV